MQRLIAAMSRFLFSLTIGLIGFAILIGLGVWQVQRLAWKEGILAEIDTKLLAAPVVLPVTVDPIADKYLPVEVGGDFTGEEIHVLVSQKDVGAGYRVIAVLETTDQRRIMVDRGFVPTTAKDQDRAAQARKVVGNLHWPDEIDSYTPAPDRPKNIWFARDVPAMAEALASDPVLVVARVTSQTTPAVAPLPIDTSAIPNNHLQYAITWFSLAAIWAAMTGYFIWRTRAATRRS
jgi:surfeit locus 1 family protein